MKLNFIDNLNISLDIFVIQDYCNKMCETIDVHFSFDEITKEVTNMIKSFGYTELEDAVKSDSGSMYFIFCKEDELNSEEVTLITKMRVSNHKLPRWKEDKTEQDAKDRQLKDFQKYANSQKWMNKNLLDTDDMPIEYLYVKYENEIYTDLDDLYKQIFRKLQAFANKHKY